MTIQGAADTGLAHLLATLGRLDEAITAAEAGDALHRRCGLDARTATSAAQLGRLLCRRGGPGDGERGRALLEEAVDLAQRLGMATTLARARAELAGDSPP